MREPARRPARPARRAGGRAGGENVAASDAGALNMSDLDRPVWASLRHQPHWGRGDERARRFKPDINGFAATPDESADSLMALADLVQPGDDSVYVLQVPPIAMPPGLRAAKAAQGVQMVATRRLQADDGVQLLGDADAAEMLALAE